MAGRVLGGRYSVQDKIGTGGMATVYRGLDNVLGRTVAIKTMLPQYAADPSFAARFKQEAQAAAALQSPYIVSVYDWGKDGDTYYIIMEYLRGTDLKSGIHNHGPLDCKKVAQIGSQIASALAVAHRHDIIHRDIKPQNIMVQPDGNIKVMDFGIARAKNSHLTQDNNVLGTAHYVSPEQTQGKELGPTSDIYSLGIVMYEAATGRVPFEGDDAISVAVKQVNEQPVPPSQLNPNVDPALEAIILKCMQKDPAARFQTADELNRTLRDYLAGRVAAVGEATALISAAPTTAMGRMDVGGSTRAMPVVTPPISATTTSPRYRVNTSAPQQQHQGRSSQGSQTGKEEKRGGGRKAFIIVAVIAAIVAVAAIAYAVLSNSSSTSQTVPNLLGLTQSQAESTIKNSNFFTVGTIKQEYSSTVDSGKVVSQDPDVGKAANSGTAINLVISKGAEPAASVSVPDLSGMTPSEAEAALTKVGLKGKTGDSIYSATVENGKVAAQSPSAGSTATAGSTVTYQLSKGADTVSVPDVLGKTESTAVTQLEAAGFKVAYDDSSYSSTYSSGTVMNETPTGSQPKGSTITITISLGSRPAATTVAATTVAATTTSAATTTAATTTAATTTTK